MSKKSDYKNQFEEFDKALSNLKSELKKTYIVKLYLKIAEKAVNRLSKLLNSLP